jgi:rod shape determining protein RodA
MWDYRALSRIDFRIVPIALSLMTIGLLVISSMTGIDGDPDLFWTPAAKSQLRWICLSWLVFGFAAGFDYRKLRQWSIGLYIVVLLLLAGLFFAPSIQNVHRWYRIFGLMSLQPSEQAKLILVICLSWFLERKGGRIGTLNTSLQTALVVGVPFFLILKQPDLGTALLLLAVALGTGYFAGLHRGLMRFAAALSLVGLTVVSLLFSGALSHDKLRPVFTTFIKDYQYDRLNPNTYHQKASQISIALGGVSGTGWHRSEFAGNKWLPAAHTDSVFAAFGEEFGFVGLTFLLFLFYALIYFSFQVAVVARDPFGRILAAGLAVYLAMHAILNSAMMCGLIPISGVPLIFVTYGGSSLLTTMAALGVLQSIYSRRFMF